MLPLIPKSVKMEGDLSAQLKATAASIGYSDNQFIVESVKGIIEDAKDEKNEVPLLVTLIRAASKHQIAPDQFGKRLTVESIAGRSAWWG